MLRVLMLLGTILAAFGLAAAASPEEVQVDIELALAVDVSRSVDPEEAQLQREGYIAAFRHPSVIDAITGGPRGRIAVTYFEWGGYLRIRNVVPWTLIDGKTSANAFAAALAADTPVRERRTSISGAIDFGATAFDANGFTGMRRVIDISGDGANNSGDLVTVARDRAVAAGITINGLPIVNDRPTWTGWQQIADLDLYYRDCVIGGPGAFYIVAKNFKDFARAVLRKLILEIANAAPPAAPNRSARAPSGRQLLVRVATPAARVAPPCDIGERRWRERWWGNDNLIQTPQPTDPTP